MIRAIVPWVLVALLAYMYGRQQGAVQQLRFVVEETKTALAQRDEETRRLRDIVNQTKERVVVVDRDVRPQVDSAVATLRSTLDSASFALVQRVIDGYEARIVERDQYIEQLERMIQRLSEDIRLRDSVIAKQSAMLERGSRQSRLAWIVPLAIAAFMVFKE